MNLNYYCTGAERHECTRLGCSSGFSIQRCLMQRINFVRVMYVTICFVNRCFVKVTIDQHKGKAVNTSPFSQIAILTNYAEVARENELVRSISLIARSLWRYVLRIIRRADVHARYTGVLSRLALRQATEWTRSAVRRAVLRVDAANRTAWHPRRHPG